MNDRRSANRMVPRRLVTASLYQPDEATAYAIVSDISEHGARVVSDGGLKRDRQLEMGIRLDTGSTKALIRPYGRIVWANLEGSKEKDYPSGSVELGVQFTRIAISHRHSLLRVLNSDDFHPELTTSPPNEARHVTKLHRVGHDSAHPVQLEHANTASLETPLITQPRRGGRIDVVPLETVEDVLIVKEGLRYLERARDAVLLAGLWPVVVEALEPLLNEATSLPPALVILSEHLGVSSFSKTARRLRTGARWDSVPIAMATSPDANPWFRDNAYPVDATLDLDMDLSMVAQTVRLVASPKTELSKPQEPAALEGDLSDEMLCDILVYLLTTQKRGRLTVRFAGRTGYIYLEAGNVIHCDLGDSSGREAFSETLASPQEGYFRFDLGVAPHQPTMCEHGMQLVVEATRQRDHRARLLPATNWQRSWFASSSRSVEVWSPIRPEKGKR